MPTELPGAPNAGVTLGGTIIPRFSPVNYELAGIAYITNDSQAAIDVLERPANPAGQEDQNPVTPPDSYVPSILVGRWFRSTFDVSDVLVEKGAIDNAAGVLYESDGSSMDYATGALRFAPEDSYRVNGLDVERSITGTTGFNPTNGTQGATAYQWQDLTPQSDTWADGSTITVRYAEDVAAPNTAQELFDPPPIVIDLTPRTRRSIVASSVVFRWGTGNAATYFDRGGVIYRDIDYTTGFATVAGSIDYRTGQVTLTDYVAQPADTAIEVLSLLLAFGEPNVPEVFFRTAASPIRPASLNINAVTADGEQLTGTADFNGTITGTKMRGEVDTDSGVVQVEFGEVVGSEWVPTLVVPELVTYNAVAVTFVPVDPQLLGLDPVRLPADGRVAAFRSGDPVVIHHTMEENLSSPLSAGDVETISRSPVQQIYLRDQNGDKVDGDLYTVNLTAGSVTMATPLDLSTYSQPLVAVHRIEEMRQVAEVEISGVVTVTQPLTLNFPADDSHLSSALAFGDLRASVSNFFEQETWTGVWSDTLIGDPTTAQYNELDNEVEVQNDGSINQRWALIFTSSTAFNIVGEELGVIGSGTTSVDAAPVNPNTGLPYFIIRNAGWGTGWATDNVVRFNTSGANAPMWLARTTLQGPPTEPDDNWILENRGDAD